MILLNSVLWSVLLYIRFLYVKSLTDGSPGHCGLCQYPHMVTNINICVSLHGHYYIPDIHYPLWNHPASAPVLPRSLWKAMSISIEASWQYTQRPIATLWQGFTIDSHIVLPRPVFSSGVRISPIAPKAVCRIFADCTQLRIIDACKLQSQRKLVIIPANIWPVILKRIVERDWYRDCSILYLTRSI